MQYLRHFYALHIISRNLNNECPFLNPIWNPTFLNLLETQLMCFLFSASFIPLFLATFFPTLKPKDAFKQQTYVYLDINSVLLVICSLPGSSTRSAWLHMWQRMMGAGGPIQTEGSHFSPLCYIVTEIKLHSLPRRLIVWNHYVLMRVMSALTLHLVDLPYRQTSRLLNTTDW